MEINHPYQKKMTAYLDGTLSSAEKNEFEAYAAMNSDFSEVLNKKKEEFEFLKSIIPEAEMSEESMNSLKSEIKFSVDQLLSDEKPRMLERVKSFFTR